MKTGEGNLRQGAEARREVAASAEELPENIPTEGWVSDAQLNETVAARNPLQEPESRRNCASYALASGRRSVRLLWIALVISLAAHLIIPVCLVSAMMRPEKVALMDGTE